jgi:AcrR family transcriptional regulator
MTVEPVRQAFRRQVHEQALDTAQAMLVERGWDQVRFGDVAVAIGVSRPTLYAAFGNKEGLAEALVLKETDRFLTGISATLDVHAADPVAAVTAAVAFTLEEADRSPVLHAATSVLVRWFAEHVPGLDSDIAQEGVDALVRLVVSHLVLPADDPSRTADRLARLAVKYLELSR